MNNNLIIDAGMHKCEDTSYYLKRGFKVVSIDADLNLVKLAEKTHAKYINSARLVVLHYALSDKDNEEITFNLSQETIWNSINANISDRNGKLQECVSVPTQKLSSIIKKYGVPYYCKIDLEGYDNTALKTLAELEELPRFISVETECLAEDQIITENECIQTLNSLKDLGYNKFKLVDQFTLSVLKINRRFYKDQLEGLLGKWYKYLSTRINLIFRYDLKSNHTFPVGSSGCFGNDIGGKWVSYDDAKKLLIKHRSDYFKTKNSLSFGFWCDWHARRD
jgi:FkbM family methyltransferase